MVQLIQHAYYVSFLLLFIHTTSAFTTSSKPATTRPFSSSSSKLYQQQSIENTPVVICPGFGNDSIDYETPLDQPYETSLLYALESRNFKRENIYIVPVQRSDWIRVAGGLLDIPDFYRGTAKPFGLGYGWYLNRVKETVDLAFEECNQNKNNADSGGEKNSDNNKVLLIGHSAGGWLARAAMGDGTWDTITTTKEEKEEIRTADRIKCLVTVGAIHKVPETDPKSCVTKGALSYTDETYPGAFLKDEGVGYVSIGGAAIMGNNDKSTTTSTNPTTEADDLYAVRGEGSAARVAYNSYTAVCGQGDVIGDGVVPFEWTQLEGAEQLRLDGVVHSINEAGTTIPTDRWYGSDGVVDRWLPTVLKEAGISDGTSSSTRTDGMNGNLFEKWVSDFGLRFN